MYRNGCSFEGDSQSSFQFITLHALLSVRSISIQQFSGNKTHTANQFEEHAFSTSHNMRCMCVCVARMFSLVVCLSFSLMNISLFECFKPSPCRLWLWFCDCSSFFFCSVKVYVVCLHSPLIRIVCHALEIHAE